jgi:lysozyme
MVVKKLKYGGIINMNISNEGISLIKRFEGCELEAYKCAAGVWTIGYGHTKNVKEGMTISKEQADNMLLNELDEYCEYVEKAVDVVLNNKEYEEVPNQIKRWNKSNGEVLQGLVRRREAEALLFEGKDWTEV